MVLYGPSPVTATAVAVVKNVACKVLGMPQGRVLCRPKSIATPNRISFELNHPSLPLSEDKSLVEVRQEIDKEVNRMIRADIPVEVVRNMTLAQLLERFGGEVIDRFYDINESEFAEWLFQSYESLTGTPIWNNQSEQKGPYIWRKRYTNVEGVEIDQQQSVQQFLNEINGQPIDTLSKRQRRHYLKKREYLRENGFIEKDISDKQSEFELVTGKRWTSQFGVYDRRTATDYSNADETLRFSAFNIHGVGCGLCLANHYSRHWNSETIGMPVDYLASTGELGKIVVFTMSPNQRNLAFDIDVFPGYNSEVIGPNPYYMFRETFNIKHLASIIPEDHDLVVPELAIPVDYQEYKGISNDATTIEESEELDVVC